MPVAFAPTPPAGSGGPRGPPPTAPGNRSKAPSGVKEILKTVTPNYVVTAVIKNRLEEGKIKAQRKKRRTRQEILAGMDLRELQVCWLLKHQPGDVEHFILVRVLQDRARILLLISI